jgi:hypothetical protein
MRRRSAVVRAASCCVDWGRKTFAWVRFFAALRMTADNQEQKAKHKTKRPARKIRRADRDDTETKMQSPTVTLMR